MTLSSPLLPLTVILEVDHGGAWREHPPLSEDDRKELEAKGYHPRDQDLRRYWEPEGHQPLVNVPVILDTRGSYEGTPRVCRYCGCSPTHHGIPHPRLTILVNPSLVQSVEALTRVPVAIVRMLYHKHATQTLPGMVIGYDEEYYLVAGTVAEVLEMLSYPEGTASNLDIVRRAVPG